MNPFQSLENLSVSMSSGTSGGNISGGDKINFGPSSGSKQESSRTASQSGGSMSPDNAASTAAPGGMATAGGGISNTAIYALAGAALVVGVVFALRT